MSREENMQNAEQPSSNVNPHHMGQPSNTVEHGTDLHGSNMLEASNT